MNKDLFHFYFSFSGRATRYDFNIRYALVMLLGSFIAFFIDWGIQGNAVFTKDANLLFSNLWNLIVLVPTFAITCRRLHDMDYSGWWQALVYLLPIGFIVILVMIFGLVVLGNPLMAGFSALAAMIIIGVFYLVFFIALSCKRGTVGDNRFGVDLLEVTKNVSE